MRFILLVLMLFAFAFMVGAQNTLRVKVVDRSSDEALPGANITIRHAGTGSSTDVNGFAEVKDLPAGITSLTITYVGYADTTVSVTIPFRQPELLILLTPNEEALEEVIVSSTRTNSRIEDLPLKVEVLGLEEMDEESALVPGNIASILGDLAVITIQRTNPINGNDAIRMQGLDPQYTLVARDGLPLYGGFSGSLGVLSIPPLDLKQIEIIKGSVSTLYGGGAIAGMINIISKEPSIKPQKTLLFNYSTLNEKNVNTFFSGKISKRTGYTLVAGANIKSAVDVNKDGFTEIPEHNNFIIHPRFFFTMNDKAKLNIGLTSNIDNRETGDIDAVKHGQSDLHPYLRKEKSFRNGLDLHFTYGFSKNNLLSIKTAASDFHRELRYPYRNNPDFHFRAHQVSSYSEISDRTQAGKHTVVTGLNLITESFRKLKADVTPLIDYDFVTLGFFAQDDWKVNDKFTIEGGVRYDHHNVNGNFFLPRIALFYKASGKLSFRVASGAGYKAPNVLALSDPTPYLINNGASVKSEYSTGVNADINFHTLLFDELELSLNQAFYYAEIKNPLKVITDTINNVAFLQTQNFTNTSIGSDTYIQMVYKSVELYVGYNHTEALQKYPSQNIFMPFNPKDKISATLAYAVEGKWRAGIEASYTANQFAYGNQYYYAGQNVFSSRRVPNFWFVAAMAERKFHFGSIILNVENLTDARQAHHGKLVEGTTTSPTFKPIWGQLDGRVFNLSVKVNL
jgi:iron complex outermembrane receptor protein/outer membrane receptor for ferrienterochelin and colicins